MSLALYEESLSARTVGVRVRFGDGRVEPMDIGRWRGEVTRADESMLRRVRGCCLDIGCGPGRLTAMLHDRGTRTLGIDIAPTAIALTRRSGAAAVLCSVFGAVPDEARWRTILLADGNIGIGGHPDRLLRRCRALLDDTGRVLVELAPAGVGHRRERARLEQPAGSVGGWFPWAAVGVDAIALVAAGAGFRRTETWSVSDTDGRPRHFAALGVAR